LASSLPNGGRAILDIRKLADYCLNPAHPRGRHKARVFRQALGFERGDAAELRDRLLEAARDNVALEVSGDVRGKPMAGRCRDIATRQARCGKINMANTGGRIRAAARDLLGVVMETESRERQETSALVDTVALLSDMPAHGLVRGQVGTVVEALDRETLLVEFSGDEGRAYAIASCPRDDLLFLRTVRRAA
jgi:hypothetical protein